MPAPLPRNRAQHAANIKERNRLPNCLITKIENSFKFIMTLERSKRWTFFLYINISEVSMQCNFFHEILAFEKAQGGLKYVFFAFYSGSLI